MKKTIGLSLLLALIFLNTACQAEVTEAATATTIPTSTSVAFVTATLPVTNTPQASATASPAPSATPIPPVIGKTISQVYVRDTPSKGGEQVGTIEIFAEVEIVGTDPSKKWWLILFSESPTGKGWIAAEFVQVKESSSVPVVSVESTNAPQASITEASLGTGEAVATPTSTPTLLLAIAPADGDSAENPAIIHTLSKVDLPYFEYSSELSAPEGDGEDWVQFSLAGDAGQERIVAVVVDNTGSGRLNLELMQNGVLLQSWEKLDFSRHQLQLYLYVGAPYTLHFFPASREMPTYNSYKVSVQLTK